MAGKRRNKVWTASLICAVLSGAVYEPLAFRFAHAAGADEFEAQPVDASQAGEAEFDFLIGEWKVRHRRLRPILQRSTQWYEFDGILVARKFWQGRGHIDEFRAESPHGQVDGLSIRIYEPSTRQWRDYYTGASRRILDQPLVGRFQGDRAEFYGQELFEGRSIIVRQIWTRKTPTSCRWEQAFSEDGGKTWETNWIMELSR